MEQSKKTQKQDLMRQITQVSYTILEKIRIFCKYDFKHRIYVKTIFFTFFVRHLDFMASNFRLSFLFPSPHNSSKKWSKKAKKLPNLLMYFHLKHGILSFIEQLDKHNPLQTKTGKAEM
jgi:hypothetical protein